MSRTVTCECPAPHYERVELGPLHLLGPGVAWRAAIPGKVYLVGHGWHFDTEDAAKTYIEGASK